ncbi:liprin-beta-1-like isoform X3 [Apostichopus japonicus]|uniref:liprin-beta-1-like isoform X3 n=1 Tax=Stichopus japonicus TaxID=307972 RepID=UPI003AB38AB4
MAAQPEGDPNDASDMLAAALEQMDDIIAGTKLQSAELQNGLMESEQTHFTSPGYGNPTMIPKLAEDLRIAAERADEQGEGLIYRDQVPQWTKDFLSQWLQSNGALMDDDVYQNPHDRVQRLESEKHSLHLQVNVLSEQVEIQTEKIQELEYALSDSDRKLFDTESRLQEERRMRRPSYDDIKRNESNELVQLQLRLSSAENEVALLRERTLQAESRLEEKEQDLYILEEKYEGLQRALKDVQDESRNWQEKYMESQVSFIRTRSDAADLRSRLRRSFSEMEQMHSSGPTRQQMNADRERYSQVIESLQTSNNEKDRIIEDMRRNFRKYKRIEEIFITAQGSKAELVQRLEEELARTDTGSTSSSVTVESESSSRMGGGREDGSLDYAHNSLPRELNGKHRSASMENLKPVDGLLETDIDLYPGGYRTLPSPKTKTSEPNSPVKGRNGSQRSGSFDKDNLQKGRKTSTSEPNLAVTETEDGFMEVHRRRQVTFDPKTDGLSDSSGTSSSDVRAKKGGIKKLIGKLRRSNSASLQDEDYDSPIEFHRGSRYRATAMPRLGWSQGLSSHGRMSKLQVLNHHPKLCDGLSGASHHHSMWNIDQIARWHRDPQYFWSDTDAPFAKWDVDQVAGWMHEMGLGRYVAMCRVWIKNGTTLLQASPIELERNLSMRNPLHRKKLQLALQAIGSEQVDDPGQLDYNWVTRWLDDIGLPQYKDAFSEARIDGRMLHYLSVDDLLMLKVTSALHHASIMRGIQCLRLNKFHPHCLRRRPTDEPWYKDLKTKPAWSSVMPYENGTEVMLWTNHRVMDWLRSVDLSEYAPNLRGSGVHGGLMTLENRFTAETLATLLSIPASKTLLRRHLGTHFMSLCGHDIQHAKRIAEKSVGFMPLNVIGKVKPKKRSFGARKRRGMEDEDFLCPMEEPLPVPLTSVKPQITAANNNTQPQPGHGNYKVEVRSAERVHKQADEILLDGPEMEENTTTEIGAFSAELNTLTSKLEDDVHLNRSTHV